MEFQLAAMMRDHHLLSLHNNSTHTGRLTGPGVEKGVFAGWRSPSCSRIRSALAASSRQASQGGDQAAYPSLVRVKTRFPAGTHVFLSCLLPERDAAVSSKKIDSRFDVIS